MRKFLELARMTLMEDIVAVEDIETTLRVFDRGKDKHDAPHEPSDFSNPGTLVQESHETPRFRSPRCR